MRLRTSVPTLATTTLPQDTSTAEAAVVNALRPHGKRRTGLRASDEQHHARPGDDADPAALVTQDARHTVRRLTGLGLIRDGSEA